MSGTDLPLALIRTGTDGRPSAHYPHLNRSFRAEVGSEECVRVDTYNFLLTKYAYPVHRIEIEVPVKIRDDETPRFADLVVYDDDEHKRPFIVVETKKPHRRDGERQAQRYATILRATYTLWNNGTDPMTASTLVNRYPEEAISISDVPVFGGQPRYDVQTLDPFPDDRAAAAVIRRCHALIRSCENKKPDEAFDEFLKVLLVKFTDESSGGDYEFQVRLRGVPPVPEDRNEIAQRVRALFHASVVDSQGIADVFAESEDIRLRNETLAQLVQLLQTHSFSSTDVDVKARAFETFLSGDLRQGFKEFMTPRPVVEAVVAMADPTPGQAILDPCCGSAAFLIVALRQVRRGLAATAKLSSRQIIKRVFDFAHDRLWGMDSSRQMANVGRLNMLVNEDGRGHIFCVQDSLAPVSDAPPQLRSQHFDFVMTNPPFGQKIAAPSALLESFGVVKLYPATTRMFLSEILFLERNVEWLKPRGCMFIVLPDSVLGNEKLAAARAFIETKARLLAVLSLPAETFGPSGAKSKTSVVVLERLAHPTTDSGVDDDVFLADVREVGYDFTGRRTEAVNQLPDVAAAFRRWKKGRSPGCELVAIVPRSALGALWLAPRRPVGGPRPADASSPSAKYWLLGDICSAIGTGKTGSRNDYVPEGLHLVKVGNLTGRGIEWGCVERQFVPTNWTRRFPDARLAVNDILFTASAHGPKWIGLKVDIFAGMPRRFGTRAAFCGELMRLRVDPLAGLDPWFVLLFLRSPAGYAEIQRCIRGQSGHVYREQVAQVQIPRMSGAVARTVRRAVNHLQRASAARMESAMAIDRAETLLNRVFPSAGVKPVIAR